MQANKSHTWPKKSATKSGLNLKRLVSALCVCIASTTTILPL